MVINYQTIKADLQTNKSTIFIQEFPELKDAILQFKSRPACSSCEMNVIPRMFSSPKIHDKLKLIYGDGWEIDLKTPPIQNQWEPMNNVYVVPMDQYELWFKNFNKLPNQQIRIFSTTYNPDNKSMIISVFGMQQKV